MVKFLRRVWRRYSKLGKGRKKKQVWRRPTGRDNKMREKRKGVPVVVSIGYKQSDKVRGLLKEKKQVLVMNFKDLEKVGKNEIAIIGKVGMKKKIELAKKAKEMKINIYNLNAKSFLKATEKKKALKEKAKKEREEKKVKTKEEKKKEKAELKKKTKEEKKTSKKEIVEDIKESGVPEEVAEKEEALDEKAQEEEK